MSEAQKRSRGRPGPHRPDGAPAGPDDVRRAVIDAAAQLFATRGVDGTSLRDVAARADVNPALINRYVGNREELVLEVFDDLSRRLAADVDARPGLPHGFSADTVMGQWVRLASALVISGRPIAGRNDFEPVQALARNCQELYGLDPAAARLRAAQIMGSAIGWRIFEGYLIDAAGLGDRDLDELREELTRTHRRLGATPWPSPPDPPRSDA